MEFLWGAATSSHQIEGNNVHNDWWRWECEGRTEGGTRSGRATDHWNRFREDLRLAADLGLNSYRFSVEWSRVEPEEGRFDEAAIEWYRELLDECEKLGLMPMLTLHHFTSPVWFADQGGFTQADAHEKFGRFVSRIAKELGPQVPFWCTLNEPMVLVVGTYFGNFMPPGKFSPDLASRACHGLLKSHARAYDILHSEIPERRGRWRELPISVGLAHNMLDFMPDRWWHPLERLLSLLFRRFYNQSWLEAITGGKQRFGIPWLMPFAQAVPEAGGRKTVDFIGVNYYTKAYVQWRPRHATPELASKNLPIGITFAHRKEPVSDLQWAVHPRGFRRVLSAASCYGLPIYVTENGMADHDDSDRPAFLEAHLREMELARAKGADVRGYYYWSLLDNFEWHKGFGPRFGLYRVDYDSFERVPTRTAAVYRDWIHVRKREL